MEFFFGYLAAWLVLLLTATETESSFPSNPFPNAFLHNTLFRAVTNPCETGYIQAGKKCLLVEKWPMTWFDAFKKCSANKATLLTLPTGNEYAKAVKALGTREDSLWVGATFYHATWHWLEERNTPVHQSFWAIDISHGTPIHETPSDPAQSCAFIDGARFNFMDDDQCFAKRGFVCQKEAKEVKPALQQNFFSYGHEAQEKSCDEGWKEFGDSCYSLLNFDGSFQLGDQICKGNNATLATPSTQEENDFLQGYAESNDQGSSMVWIGLQQKNSMSFEWMDEEEYYFNRFTSSEAAQPMDNHCVSMSSADGTWMQADCFQNKRVVCERDATAATEE